MSIRDELPKDIRDWTEGMWLAAEREQKEKEEADIPVCLRCGTKPNIGHGYEELFCKCGMVHVVKKREDRRDENSAAKEFKKST